MNRSISTELIPGFSHLMRLRFSHAHALVHDVGLHPGQVHLLTLIASRASMSQAQLASLLFIKPSTVTVMVSRMASTGILKRTRDEHDKRLNKISITEKGRALLKIACNNMKTADDKLFDGFSADELETMLDYATRMRNNLLQEHIASEGSSCGCY